MTPGLIPYIGGQIKSRRSDRGAPAAGDLIHLYKQIAFRGPDILAAIESLPISRRLFADFLRADPLYLSPVWRAARTYYLLAYSFGAKGETFNGDHSRPLRSINRADLEAFRSRTARVIWESMDAFTLIERYDSPETAFYVDPPYLGKDWYRQKFGGAKRHAALRDQLAGCKGRWLLSHHDTPEIRALYQSFRTIKLPVRYAIATGKKRPVNELLIANYP